MYEIHVCAAEERCEDIVRYRQEICRRIGLDPNGPAGRPNDFTTYLFIEHRRETVGMVEFFCYDQRFAAYADVPYARAEDVAALAPLHELAHVCSVILDARHRGTRAFLLLTAAMIRSTSELGVRYLTAATGANNSDIIALHRNAGMTPFGAFRREDTLQVVSLLDVRSRADQARHVLERHAIALDRSRLLALRGRRSAELHPPALAPAM
jgi:hypothetical protein